MLTFAGGVSLYSFILSAKFFIPPAKEACAPPCRTEEYSAAVAAPARLTVAVHELLVKHGHVPAVPQLYSVLLDSLKRALRCQPDGSSVWLPALMTE